jgi:DNA-directed RNA polymerase specialized sigma subunit
VKRYVCKQDDEWSVALTAFAEAIEHFETDKGSFDTFAKLVIKRRLIDYERNVHKRNAEFRLIRVSLISMENKIIQNFWRFNNKCRMILCIPQDCSAAEEIAMMRKRFRNMGLHFLI